MMDSWQDFDLSKIARWTLAIFMAAAFVYGLVQIQLGIVSALWTVESRQNEGYLETKAQSCSEFFRAGEDVLKLNRKIVSIEDFGGVGDGKTLNTDAFHRAVEFLRPFSESGLWVQLDIPSGRWLTGSFNITNNFVLFLRKNAVILGSQDLEAWPLIEPLPSYGRGRERPGGRHISLIHGGNLKNVVITGENGTIDGQGSVWWDMWFNRTLKHTRGHLVEFINTQNILISNVTFLNSPFWNIHPVYCRNIVIKHVTIMAPLTAPNTDGIDADSSSNVCIEDCYIESGDDLVAIKSGWDQYGISVGHPSLNIIIQRIEGTTPTCSGIGIGSEMSGGIKDVFVKDIKIYNAYAGIKVKTDIGRGGYVNNITISDMYLENVKTPIKFTSHSNDHPDDKWSPNDIPLIKGIIMRNITGKDIHNAPSFKGLEKAPFTDICLVDIKLEGIPHGRNWHCEYVEGFFQNVSPSPCSAFQVRSKANTSFC